LRVDIQGLTKPTRLDRALRDRFPEWGRQAIQQLISAQKVRVNGKAVWLASWQVNNGDKLELLATPPAKPTPPQRFADDWLLAQEADLIVVNKPAGLLAETPRFRDGVNLLDLARERFGELILFHRLDRDTSGVVLLTRPGPVNQYLDQAFKSSQIQKTYLAVVATPNQLQPEGTITARLDSHPQRRDMMTVVPRGGKHAMTAYKLVAEDKTQLRQLIELHPQTGRTHQLRVHLAHLGAPILGDRLYGDGASAERLLLHAQQIVLPALADYPQRSYRAPLPDEFVT
jgi:RluA family pseudouridine synthase